MHNKNASGLQHRAPKLPPYRLNVTLRTLESAAVSLAAGLSGTPGVSALGTECKRHEKLTGGVTAAVSGCSNPQQTPGPLLSTHHMSLLALKDQTACRLPCPHH